MTRRLTGTLCVVVYEAKDQERPIGALLRIWGFDVTTADDATAAHAAINRRAAALAIADGRSRNVAAQDLLVTIRASGWSIPVLVVCSDEHSVVAALTSGADDAFALPYSSAELSARVHALLRRTYRISTWKRAPLKIGRLTMDPVTREATRDGVPVPLSPKEHELLLALLEHRGRPLTRRELLARVWPERSRPNARTLDMHVAWLRRKIESDPRRPTIIRTVRSVGYEIRTS